MSLSVTYRELPEELLQPLLDGHLLMWEASWLWDEWLLTPRNSSRTLPPELWDAADKLTLLAMEVDPTMH